jgi:hypothetical protein
MTELNERYWDCECVRGYIHSKTEKTCSVCGATEEEQPDSHQSEIDEGIHFHNINVELWKSPHIPATIPSDFLQS